MGNQIDAMTVASTVAGSELLFLDDSGPKSVTPTVLKNFIVDQIEAISAGTVVDGSDKVYILDATDSALKPVDIDTVAQHAIDTIWAKTAETSADGADVIPLKDGGTTEKTLTLANLATYIRGAIEATILDVSDLDDGSGALATSDYMLVTQGTTAKQITVQDLYDAIYTGLDAHVGGLSAAATPTGTDTLYLIRSGTGYEVTMTQIATFAAASAVIDGSGTANALAQWADTDTLQAGPTITESGTGFSAGSNTALPTSAAVRGEMDTIINDATAIGAALVAADTILVDDGAAGTQRKAAMSRVKTFVDTVGTYKTIWVPASRMVTKATSGAAALTSKEFATNDINLEYFAFDGAAEEGVQFALPMPEDWDLGSIKAKFMWSSAAGSTTADTVEWEISANALSDDDAVDAALGTSQVISDALLTDADDLHVTAATPAITVGGTPALGDLTVFEVSRNVGGTDDMAEDAFLYGVWIQYQATQEVAAW